MTNVTKMKPGKNKKKSFGEVRQRYRSNANAKSFRRRLRKSAPGASMVYIRAKDLERAKQAAVSKGIRMERLGPHKGFEKIKLLGDDTAIDSLAKEFGAAIFGRKSLDGEPVMGAKLNKKTKAMPEEVVDEEIAEDEGMVPGDQPSPPPDEMVEEEEVVEPLGAQVLRRVYEHQKILMEEYDEFMRVLEQEGVKNHLLKILQRIEQEMTQTEELFSEAYAELQLDSGAGEDGEEVESDDKSVEPASDADDADDAENDPMDDNPADPATSTPKAKVPPPEEVVEGMENNRKGKSLQAKVKNIRKRIKTKGCSKCGHEDEKSSENKLPGDGGSEEANKPSSEVGKSGSVKPEKYHVKVMYDSVGFLDNVSKAQSLSDDIRFDAYHYSKTLGGMIQVTDMAQDDKNLEGGDAQPMPMEEKGWHKAVKETSTFLGELATSADFGDSHRERAKNCHGMMSKALEEFDSEATEVGDSEIEDDGNDMPEVGDMDVKTLRDMQVQINQQMEQLSKQFAAIPV